MSSTALNSRTNGSIGNTIRTSRLNGYSTNNGRIDSDEQPAQSSSNLQTYGNGNAWQANNGIWGGTAIGSGLSGGRRDLGRPRIEEDANTFAGINGLTATSEEDTQSAWNRKHNAGPWNADTTSPTSASHSGSTSPVRHRGQGIPSMLDAGSLFSNSTRNTANQQLGSRTQPQSNLDPASGTFSYTAYGQAYKDGDEEKQSLRRDSVPELDGNASRFQHRGSFASLQGTASREASLPPSRQSDINPSGYNSYFGITNSSGTLGHTPTGSQQRPNVSRAQSYLSQNSTSLDATLSAMSLSDRPGQGGYIDFASHEPYQSQSSNNLGTYASDAYRNAYGNSIGHKQSASTARGLNLSSIDNPRSSAGPSYFPENGLPYSSHAARHPYGVRSSVDMDRGQARQYNNQYINSQLPSPAYQPFDPRQYPADFRSGISSPYGYSPFSPGIAAPRGPARDQQDAGHGVRSVVLEEFRSNSKTNRKYELKDIYGHVVEFSGDQHGSRFIQQKLETANSDEKEQIFNEIQPNALQLMTDVFGNYVIQKLFEHCNQIQKKLLADAMRNHVNELSVQMYGCRVVQKALEHVLTAQQAELVKELESDILRCVKDQNGNHVVQKAIERIAPARQFILEAFKGQVHNLAAHTYGCRVVQRMLEYCSEQEQSVILDELFESAEALITDQYGNYVIQHVIAKGKEEHRAKIIAIVTAQLLPLSKHKFASNVVEKSIQFGSDEQRHAIVSQMTALNQDGSSPLQLMMKDQYGNYVVQKLLGQLQGDERVRLVELIKPQLFALKRYNYGKQIAAIEKLIFTEPITAASYAPAPITDAFGGNSSMSNTNSVAPTPSLTTEANSPESSFTPSSTSASVVGLPATEPSAKLDNTVVTVRAV